jgi:hypothetical protein
MISKECPIIASVSVNYTGSNEIAGAISYGRCKFCNRQDALSFAEAKSINALDKMAEIVGTRMRRARQENQPQNLLKNRNWWRPREWFNLIKSTGGLAK